MKRWRGVVGVALGVAVAVCGAGAQEEPPIAAVQALLKEQRLYSGPVDGSPGTATTAAVRRYQILHGLTATGLLNQPTLATMLAPPPPSPKLTESDREVLRELEAVPPPAPVGEEHREPIPPAPPLPAASPAPTPAKGKHAPAVKRSRPQPRASHALGGPRGD